MARTLIICPTFDHCDTLLMSLSSVRAQSDADWRMVVVCDGSPPRTEEIAAAFAEADARIEVVVRPKGERNGEAWRDEVIRASSEPFICHLGDDDVWSSGHLSMMTQMLEAAEFAFSATLRMFPSGGLVWRFINLGTRAARAQVAAGALHPAGINNVGYRREAYLRLPVGWSPAPTGIGSDVFMWRKFFALPSLSVASTAEFGMLKFPAGRRRAATGTARAVELGLALATVNSEDALGLVRERAVILESLFEHLMRYCQEVRAIDDPAKAFRAASLELAPPDAGFNVAVDEDVMRLPLRGNVRKSAEFTLLTVRAFGTERPLPAVLDAWMEEARANRPRAERLVRGLTVENKAAGERARAELSRVAA